MSLAEIEAELDKLSSDELRLLALKSYKAFMQREAQSEHFCEESDPALLQALDAAIAEADKSPSHSADEVRSRIRGWTTK